MKVLGISPLDKDASASFVEDGKILFAAGEERFSRIKQHKGFPGLTIEAGLRDTGWSPEDIDIVAYPFLTWDREVESIEKSLAGEKEFFDTFRSKNLRRLLKEAERRVPERNEAVHGLKHPNQRFEKPFLYRLLYVLAGATPMLSRHVARHYLSLWVKGAAAGHKQYQAELENGLASFGLSARLKRYEHHLSHAANSYLSSGFERALIVTLDGYGTGLAGSICLGENGKIRRLHDMRYPNSTGSFYESVTSSLGFHPDRHAGKVVGLAAYGDIQVLSDVLLSRIRQTPGDFRLAENLNVFFSRHLAARFPMIDVAAAYQNVLEVIVRNLVEHWLKDTGCDAVVLSGGVTANVKMNQRIKEIDGVERIFIYPNMGDGGCGTGMGLYLSHQGGAGTPFPTPYLGPGFTDAEIERALNAASLPFEKHDYVAGEVARRIQEGEVVARFDGRMEYGPRALGNRSILYHGRDPGVNQWLNQRLGRTEFMPFAPVALYEARNDLFLNVDGAEFTAEFMTITFDCTERMKTECPAAVHVDGTARPQLIRRDMNPTYHDIVSEYEQLSGIPCLINTSFNMHEEPIVCTPDDAVRAFLRGHLDVLAIGNYLVPLPKGQQARERALAKATS